MFIEWNSYGKGKGRLNLHLCSPCVEITDFVFVMYCISFHSTMLFYLYSGAKLWKKGIECNLIYKRFLTILTNLLCISHCILRLYLNNGFVP